ncbi:MAG: endolytic transglycosylase MltG [Cytophagales bacterium]|nr:endolytic transglycosylase MltG [Bernardetiaceae bacterium]MDW8209974.1 endolytic transglycosylase MltG [Cytophagales bacterium]
MTTRAKIIVGIFIGVSVLLAVFSLYFYQVFFAANFLVNKPDKALYIPPKADFKQVIDSLRKGEFFNDEVSFRFVAKLLRYQDRGKVKPGRYLIKSGMNNLAVVRKLRNGEQDPVRVTFTKVRTKQELVKKITRHLIADPMRLLSLLNDPTVTAAYGFTPETIVAMFIPNTYQMYWTTSEEALLQRMKQEYDRFWTPERKSKADAIGLTPLQVSILASIVEAEIKWHEEASRIAGVYLNRLNANWKLEADPTVVFAIGDFTIKRLSANDLKYDSPYNTYLYKGLPPGPINVPSPEVIDATLNAEKHRYMFFCAKEDLSGYHAFAKTYAEHLANAFRYHQALNRIGIFR